MKTQQLIAAWRNADDKVTELVEKLDNTHDEDYEAICKRYDEALTYAQALYYKLESLGVNIY